MMRLMMFITVVFSLVGLLIGCGHENEVYYSFGVSEVNESALPGNSISVYCEGKEIATFAIPEDNFIEAMLYFPESATSIQVYSGNILVATCPLIGTKGWDNFASIGKIPDPRLYRKPSSTPTVSPSSSPISNE